MGIRLLTQEQRDNGNAAITRRMIGEQETQSSAPEYRNVNVLLSLTESVTFPWNDEDFISPPVSVPDGLIISNLLGQWDRVAGRGDSTAFVDAQKLFDTGIALLKRAMYPSSLADRTGKLRGWRKLWWKYARRNPFRTMSEREFITALLFLSKCRMKSRVGLSFGVEEDVPSQ